MPAKITAPQLGKVVEHSELVVQEVRRSLKTADPAQLAKKLAYAESVLKGVRGTLNAMRVTPPTFDVARPFLAKVGCSIQLPKFLAKTREPIR